MELMIFSMLVIVVVLMTYLFVEQSVLRRVLWIDPIEHWQEYYDSVAEWRAKFDEIDAMIEAELTEEQGPFMRLWFEKLARFFR